MFRKFLAGGFFAVALFILVDVALLWVTASAVVSGLKTGMDKCHEDWPASSVLATDWFCSSKIGE